MLLPGIRYGVSLLCVLLWLWPAVVSADERGEVSLSTAEQEESSVVLWYFRRDNCPFCERAEQWLPGLIDANPQLQLQRVDIGDGPAAMELFRSMMQELGRPAQAVPTFILDREVWVGFSPGLAADIEQAVAIRLGLVDTDPGMDRERSDVGVLGGWDLAALPMVAATAMIAFIDGFNPCSLWVLTVLLAMILGSRSRLHVAAVGLTFLLVTASIYGLFIAGLFSALFMLEHLGWIRWLVAAFALVFGLVNLKDYFAWQRGFSFSIPERFKPLIYQRGRALRRPGSLPATLLMTVVMATGVAFIELPCTAGFPVVWTTLLVDAGIERGGFIGLLLLYLLVYLSVEIGILILALSTLSMVRLKQTHGRVLKLLGGSIMIALALVLMIDPAIMETLTGSALVIISAVLLTVLIAAWPRRNRA